MCYLQITVFVGWPINERFCFSTYLLNTLQMRTWSSSSWAYNTVKKKEPSHPAGQEVETWEQKTGLQGCEVIGHLIWLKSGSSYTEKRCWREPSQFHSVNSLVVTKVCELSCSGAITALIFPSTENQQGFAIVSWRVTLCMVIKTQIVEKSFGHVLEGSAYFWLTQ